LVQNFYASQISPDGLSQEKRDKIEKNARVAKDGLTNYFQLPARGLTPPQDIKVGGENEVAISWNSALADKDPISHYEVFNGKELVGTILHIPQTTTAPFRYTGSSKADNYKVVTVDKAGNRAESEEIVV
jgi:hypothetical protein